MSRETGTNASKEPPEIHSLLLIEYGTLREEILKRIELRTQVTSLALIVFGTMMSFGLQARSSSVILLYPILAIFLAGSWTHNGIRIREIAIYIRDQIESRIGENILAWEHRASPHQKPLDRLNFLSAGGIFIGTSSFAIVVALPLAHFDTTDILLFVFAAISVICSSLLLRLSFWKRFDNP
jgi:hypothetical protein